jgi:hypothetical protein
MGGLRVLMPRKTTTPAAVYIVKTGDLNCFTLNKPPERLLGGSRRRIVFDSSISIPTLFAMRYSYVPSL